MGDATNLVLILAGELLKKAEPLLIMGLHPSEVIQGYELAAAKALEELESAFVFSSSSSRSLLIYIHPELSVFQLPTPLDATSLARAITPTIASKQYGSEEKLASLVSEAALSVMPSNPKTFNVDNVRVVKIMGGGLYKSKVVQGMVFGREPEGDVKKVEKAKVAVFTNPIDVAQTETKGTVLIKNADEMLNFSRGEEKHMEKVHPSHTHTSRPLNLTCNVY